MFVNMANNSGYSTDQIGVVFTSEDRSKKGIKPFLKHPDINNPENHFLNDTINWMPVTGVYSAKGGEKYIIIGNFQGCNLASRKPNNPNDSASLIDRVKQKYQQELNANFDHLQGEFGNLWTEKLAYYFIDNVSVTAMIQNDSVTELQPDLACPEKPAIPENAIQLINDGSFDLSNNRKNPFWKSPSKGTPDLGLGFTGIYLYSGTHKNNREYIISKLKKTITPCETYYFSMKIIRSSSHQFAVDKIGVALTDSIYYQDNREIINLPPIFETERFKVIESTKQWIQICGVFTPNSCANYITIGNFKTDSETYVFPISSQPNEAPYAHYLIDDVSLIQIDSIPNCQLVCNPIPVINIDSIPVFKPFVSDTFNVQFEFASYQSHPTYLL